MIGTVCPGQLVDNLPAIHGKTPYFDEKHVVVEDQSERSHCYWNFP